MAPGWKLAIWGITLLVAVAQVLWHYALIRQPYPGAYFDFPIE